MAGEILDLAMVDSLCRQENLSDLLKAYGMVIMDDYDIIGLSQEAA